MKDYCVLMAYMDPVTGKVFRRRNLVEVVRHWRENFPEGDIVVAEQAASGQSAVSIPDAIHEIVDVGTDEFCKTRVLNAALQRHPGYRFYIMADADAYLDANVFAYIRSHRDEQNLIFPYSDVLYLDETDTRLVIAGEPLRPGTKDHGVVIARQTGLCNVFSKELYESAGGFDADFVGWGAEDDAFCFKTTRLHRKVIRNTGPGIVYHLFHPKVNTRAYIKSKPYIMNRKRCACIRRMSDSDFADYIGGKTSLAVLMEKYEAMGRLDVDLKWPCVPGKSLCIDSTIYDLKLDGLSFTKLMDEMLREDGPEVSLRFFNEVILPLGNFNDRQREELAQIHSRIVNLVRCAHVPVQ